MKITDITTFVAATPPPHLGGRYWIFLKLATDSGVSGYGEVYGVPFHPRVVAQMIEDVAVRQVIGRDPFRIEELWRIVYSSGYTQRPDPSLVGVLSGLEMACWDIIGQELDQPIYNLLGGRVRDRLRAYTYLYPQPGDPDSFYTDPDLSAQRAAEYAQQGWTAVKFDPLGAYSAFDPRQLSLPALDHAERFLKTVREAVGPHCDLLVGTHGQMTPAAAVRLARRMEPYEPLWFEEPLPPEDPQALVHVARHTTIPLATGERLTTKYEFARLLETRSAAILQPAIGRVGGLLEAKKIAGMAEAYYAQIAPHWYCGPIAGAAAVHLSFASPNFLIQESILDWGGFHAEIVDRPLKVQDGHILPPDAPGLGLTLNEAVVAAHPYDDDKLHLEMVNRPL